MNIDKQILDNIKTNFKTVKQIAEEIDRNPSRISIRINKLLKHNMVIIIQGQTTNQGIKPKKYKSK